MAYGSISRELFARRYIIRRGREEVRDGEQEERKEGTMTKLKKKRGER